MTPLSHPFDAQKTLQFPNSRVGKLDNFMVSYTVSLVQVVIMPLFSVIGWVSISLYLCGIILHIFGSDITFIRSNFRSLYSLDFPNCQCRLVAPSFPTVTQLDFGATIPWLLAAPYELIFGTLDPHKNYYRIIKLSHQFGKTVHDRVHHYATTLKIVPTNFNDALLLADDCTDLFSIYDFMFISDILCCHIKENSCGAPSSPKDELQGDSPHAFCLHGIEI